MKRHYIMSQHAAETARLCAHIIYDELGVELSIYSPDFIQSVQYYSSKISSGELDQATNDLSIYESLVSE